jgi:hypothetical protein
MVGDGLITLERVEVLTYRSADPAETDPAGHAPNPESSR